MLHTPSRWAGMLWRLYAGVGIALCLSGALARGLSVTRAEVEAIPPEERTGPDSFRQQWLVIQSGSDVGHVQELVLGTSCDVHVQYMVNTGCATCVATVQFLGSNRSLLNRYLVTSRDAELSIQGSESDLHMEVVVHRAASLSSVTLQSSSEVVFRDSVLVDDNSSASVSVQVTGNGKIYLPEDATYNVGQFITKVAGPGTVSITGKQINADSVDIQVQGNGSVCVATQGLQVKRRTTVQETSSGSISVDVSHFETDSLVASVQGSGGVSFTQPGRCNSANVATMGSGTVHIGPVSCANAEVAVYGSGNAVVRSLRSLYGNILGSGNIWYEGDKPQSVTGERVSLSSGERAIAIAYQGNPPIRPCLIPPHRPRQENQVVLRPDDQSPSNAEASGNIPSSTPETFSPPPPTSSITGRVHWVVLALLVGAVTFALYEFQSWRHRHRDPNEHSPLLGNDAPVYI
ncbi:hypothetical protein Poli38472_010840 [Pythium oligandrum]|uniref:Putative auto-transporter adhesin head GIN domain-containing protein n=1 Tax=Pythium oligandrum TaxID=41045 RepID=A0A8K1CEE5_PYTOL|nr:hypothetical protein Poli38472_010840 [Pythium oligandrum]|eukprot:TMW61777.1 hypothetical protein Poli38472_010840 [Pythium oligandrum]